MDHSTTASTPRSVPAGEEVLTAELKSKRHLSDESRSYIPARTPPGPPEMQEHYQYPGDPSQLGQAPQLPPLPAFTTPSSSTVSLVLRKQPGSHGMPMTQSLAPAPQYHPLYHLDPASSQHTLSSDAASETSTLAQSYREPESLDPLPVDYSLWQQQQLAFQNAHAVYPYSHYDYSMPDDASMVASSINTGNTIVDYVTEIPKMDNYSEMELAHHQAPHVGTFYLPGGGEDGCEDQMR